MNGAVPLGKQRNGYEELAGGRGLNPRPPCREAFEGVEARPLELHTIRGRTSRRMFQKLEQR